MTEQDVKVYILNVIDNVYRDVKTMTTGNLAHRQACLLHDINAIKTNIFILIRDNTKLSESLWKG